MDWALVAALLCLIALQFRRLSASSDFLQNNAEFLQKSGAQPACPFTPLSGDICLIVPVYMEQNVIEESVRHFDELARQLPGLAVCFVTTGRERLHAAPTTHDLLENRLVGTTSLFVLECPALTGTMATQLNYAIERLRSRYWKFGLFNVDSRLSLQALLAADRELGRNDEYVLQQYAGYACSFSGSIASRIVAWAAVWQNRWTLQFELGRLLLQQRLERFVGNWSRGLLGFHYVIGHGLYMNLRVLDRCGGFPDDELNEDAPFGLVLAAYGIEIRPLPFLELAAPPPRFAVYVKQQATWFNGPAYAPRYAWRLLFDATRPWGRLDSNRFYAPRILWSSVLLLAHAGYWLIGPPLLLFIVPMFMLYRRDYYLFASWSVLAMIFTWGLDLSAAAIARRKGVMIVGSPSPLESIVGYGTHCLGPFIWICRWCTGNNKIARKYKTERA